MDYQIYTSQAEKTPCADHACSILKDEKRLCQLARQTKFQRRSRGKITPVVFVGMMMKAAVQQVKSFRLLAVLGGMECEDTVAKQSVWERVGSGAADFLGAVLRQQLHAGVLLSQWKGTVRRILIGDSSTLTLHATLHKAFPGARNQNRKKQACSRIQVVMDLVSGDFLQFGLSGFTRNDQAASLDALEILQPGDLLMRDLGYCTLRSFKAIQRQGAFYLSRWRYNIGLYDQDGRSIDLLKCLRRALRQKKSEVILEVQLGTKYKLPARLVATRVPPKIAAERRRKARADRDRRLNHDAAYYELLGWSILLTNLPLALIEQTDLLELYRLRWRIENIFKAWKGGLEPGRLSNHRSNRWHLHCLLLGQMLVLSQLGLRGQFSIALPKENAKLSSSTPARPSLFKSLDILLLCGALRGPIPHPDLIQRQLSYHGLYETRRRTNLPRIVAKALA